ncbi:hypothetical protein PAXRUDRAFT_320028 [Paxillus rubicundulus Ve08.2h10]|uniref:Uncharacterized protein n=1 Tax=Paxillus rubicundulus Ve08.2h10 TaxID=930991 RepID=A0A0D0DSA8_9AGAM|nr:hypothetical protein PAXRUDRAFT_320028 [Paxillus rubicundulus Ve08.2h10]
MSSTASMSGQQLAISSVLGTSFGQASSLARSTGTYPSLPSATTHLPLSLPQSGSGSLPTVVVTYTSGVSAASAFAWQEYSPPLEKLPSPTLTGTTLSFLYTLAITHANGQPSIIFQPLVAPTDTFTRPNRALETITQVVDLAELGGSAASGSNPSFFDNHGVFAGTFVMVGIAFAVIFGCLYVVWARRRQQRSRGSLRPPSRDDILFHGVGGGNIIAAEVLATNHHVKGPIGIAITSNSRIDSPVPSSASSSPSIYPSSLPPVDFERDVREAKARLALLQPNSRDHPPRLPHRLRPPMSSEDLAAAAAKVSGPPPSVMLTSLNSDVLPLCHLRPPTSMQYTKNRLSKLSEEFSLDHF